MLSFEIQSKYDRLKTLLREIVEKFRNMAVMDHSMTEFMRRLRRGLVLDAHDPSFSTPC